jgi:hypothetical protein
MKLFSVNQAREAVSQLFKDHGLTTQTPSKHSDVHLLPISRPTLNYSLNVSAFKAELFNLTGVKGNIQASIAKDVWVKLGVVHATAKESRKRTAVETQDVSGSM